MKNLHIVTILLILLLLKGCTAEDYSVCLPKENITLLFSLPDNEGNETFAKHISTVDVMVFNTAGAHVLTHRVEKEALLRFQGVHLLLAPGAYRLICWGNALDNTKYNGIESASVPTVSYAVIHSGNTVDNSDPLFYAGVITTVPEHEGWQGVATFSTAHRYIEVYIKGYQENSNTLPAVHLNHLPAGLCLSDMAPIPDHHAVVSHKATKNVVIEGQHYAAATFRTFLFELDNSITINIINPITNKSVFDLMLYDAIEQSLHSHTVTIRIMLEFKSTGVTVTIPHWSSDDVGFGYGHGY